MKNLVSNSVKLFTLVGCVFVMFSCGDTCETCTKEGETDIEVCDEGGVGSGLVFSTAITANEAAGYVCE